MNRARVERWITFICIVVFALCVVAMLTGCATAPTKVVYDRTEVPVPYWEPPSNLVPLPEEIDLQTSHLTPDEAEADPTAALVIFGQDFGLCLGELEYLRHLYSELLTVCSAPLPEPTPPPQ